MNHLFKPLKLRDLIFKNRIFVSPMCMYSSEDGMPNDWHLVHLGSRAVGGAGLVIVEASAVSPAGRITPSDSGIWSEAHGKAFQRITEFIHEQNCLAGIQLAHAGRKASTDAPWRTGGKYVTPDRGGWQTIGPSAVAFGALPAPREMSRADIQQVVDQFAAAARHALIGNFDAVEVHMAHGYLLHEFLSPLSNHRTDDFGGSIENRMRFPLQVARVVREIWPASRPVFVRISASDWTDGGWTIEDSIRLCKELKAIGIDLIDCSSGGLVPHAKIPTTPGYQVPFADAIKREVGIASGAVGLVTTPQQAEEIVSTGKADAVLLARELLRNPYWPLHAAGELGVDVEWAKQYQRAKVR